MNPQKAIDLSFTPDTRALSSLRDVALKYSKCAFQLEQLSQEEKYFIERSVRISTIGSSTRIENAVLTDVEIDWLDTVISNDAKPTAFTDNKEKIQNKLSKDKERSIDEVAGCRSMLQVIYEQGKDLLPLTETAIRGLHSHLMEFFKPAEHYAGKYKIVPNSVVQKNSITGEETTVLETTSPGSITEVAMTDLLRWYNSVISINPWAIAIACEFVFRFLAIHPFQDGNGRLGRGLFLLTLLQSNDAVLSSLTPYLNIDRQIEKRREEYYLALRQCSGGKFNENSRKYNYMPFFNFMLKAIHAAIDDFDFYREQYRKLRNLNFSSLKVLECFKERAEIRLTASDLTETSKLPRRTVNDCISQLLERGFISKMGKGKGTYYQLIF